MVLVVLAELVRAGKGKLHPELVGLILVLDQLHPLGAGELDRLLVQLSQVGREVGLAAIPLQGPLEQLARVIKVAILQTEVVVVVVPALLAAMVPHRSQQEELLVQGA